MGTRAYNYEASVKYLTENYSLKPGYQEAMRLLNSGKDVIEDIDDPNDLMGMGFDYCHTIGIAREAYITRYGFVLVTKRLARAMAKVFGKDKVLEIMSGTGYMAYALQQEGVDIIATDNHSWDENVFHTVNPYVNIQDIDCLKAIEWYAKNDSEVRWVLMSWPPYDEPIASQVVALMEEINTTIRKDNPMHLFYIGEDEGGCTGDCDFFEQVYRTHIHYNNPFDKEEEKNGKILRNWNLDEGFLSEAKRGTTDTDGFFREFNGIHDWPYIFRWKGEIYDIGLTAHEQADLNSDHTHYIYDSWVDEIDERKDIYYCRKCHNKFHLVDGHMIPIKEGEDA